MNKTRITPPQEELIERVLANERRRNEEKFRNSAEHRHQMWLAKQEPNRIRARLRARKIRKTLESRVVWSLSAWRKSN
jgi:hypothetical protein